MVAVGVKVAVLLGVAVDVMRVGVLVAVGVWLKNINKQDIQQGDVLTGSESLMSR